MSLFQDTDPTLAVALEKAEFTNIIDEEMREKRDNNSHCGDVSMP
jgi:hypothetical protein